MTEEKTKQPQQPQKQTSRQKLRSLWAQIQCHSLLRVHRLKGKTADWKKTVSALLLENPILFWLGNALYSLGFSTEYWFVCVGRRIRGAALFLAKWLRELWDALMTTAFPGAAQMFRDLFGPFYYMVRGVVHLFGHAHRIHREKGFGAAMSAGGRYVADGFVRYIALLPRTAMYILPVLALAGMSFVFRYAVGQPYALAVQVNGETVGYVENETVFDSAREDVQERINYAGTARISWTVEPTYTLAISGDVMDENEMADAILRTSSDEISEGTALYLDGELTAVCADGAGLRSYFRSLTEPYEDPEDPNVTVGFNREVTLEEGIYFNESFQPVEKVEEMLSGVTQEKRIYTVQAGDSLYVIARRNGLTLKELCALNADFTENGENGLTQSSKILPGDELTITKEESVLEVRITKVETHQEEIPYSTETTKTNEYTVGTTKVTQEGQNGLQNVTVQNIYDASGALLEQTVISTEVVREPVTQKITVGTKKVTMDTAYITGSGQFIWPVPTYRYCSRWYGGSHKGVDICAPAGTPIYATAAGTVSKAGYNKAGAGTGYGYSVILNHSGGYSSVYAHCISLTVSAGQTVKQGQLIGYVGSTGRSTGNHCHFEIRLNGTKLRIQNFFPSYYR